MFDMSLLGDALLGRLAFRPGAAPHQAALAAGRHALGVPVPLLVMFHGAGGSADKVLPFLIDHAQQRGFLLLLPQSQFPTWDLVIGGNGPDLERLEQALTEVASRFLVDPAHLGFAGFSDGGSYALSAGVTNGDVASHVMVFSGGFMSVFQQHGSPRIFIAHGLQDEQLPIATSARPHVAKLKAAGYDVTAVEFKGPHHIEAPVVTLAMEFFLGPLAPQG